MSTVAVTTPRQKEEDKTLEITLRPSTLKEFIGQANLKKNLHVLLGAAKHRKEPIEHVLLYGGAGIGKTTLAHIIANEMGKKIRVTAGPAIERAGDIAAILTSLEEGDIFFIDEIHRLQRIIEETLYPVMEDFVLDVIAGKGPAARTLRIALPRFTLIGATTRMSLMSHALRDRFGAHYKLDFYANEEIEQIIRRSAKILSIAIDHGATQEIARRARRTPRIANRLLKRVRDFAQVHAQGNITKVVAQEALDMLEIDAMGLDFVDRKLLMTIIEKFRGGPVGLQTIAAATAEEQETIEEIYEPFLIQMGLLERTSRGRMITAHAYRHLGLGVPRHFQGKLNV